MENTNSKKIEKNIKKYKNKERYIKQQIKIRTTTITFFTLKCG